MASKVKKHKVKSRKAAASRYSVTGSGKKVKFRPQGMRHILTKKPSSRKRKLRQKTVMSGNIMKKIKVMMPY
ncbi:50S ribosomal protein L35 [Entomospira culicis]|uniref:Large ribosomal subunit protein bL35 n=1 Tax=Entomospira culicis TaxID=2719989 RepID=A0A968GHD8_9SPIO|nr:50S ribosomal protein L35 [Entomospira culicis]NIZ18847.1 50S ribosomal protein L35 [Entomospira culicis]NIZ69062.1 50S ribosomal protein L35 [Entomospira culicis]WDI37650.1 50S ribosomal protein L35 [Entomospira culicis]WDI39278.1 50S ribosomal protein L35 [Entomospira culicis]